MPFDLNSNKAVDKFMIRLSLSHTQIELIGKNTSALNSLEEKGPASTSVIIRNNINEIGKNYTFICSTEMLCHIAAVVTVAYDNTSKIPSLAQFSQHLHL